MPVLDGVEATKALREMAHFQQLPIIAMTANVMAADTREQACHAQMPFEQQD